MKKLLSLLLILGTVGCSVKNRYETEMAAAEKTAAAEQSAAKVGQGQVVEVSEETEQAAIAACEKRGAEITKDEDGIILHFGLIDRPRRITDADLVHLKAITSLKHLVLFRTQVTDAGLMHLKGITSLKGLTFHSTKITDAGLVHLKGLTNLEGLYLDDTQITDAGLEQLKGLTKLEELSIQSTQVTDAGVAELQKALPNCKISH